ncbi:MAG: 1,4-alpha-glucan branching enzyme, partial [Angelakisella sp.]|nr:1,4-alpha-glucan branching enzyme [Angelakisella sp.]
DYVRELNHFYLKTPALWEIEDSWDGYQWIDVEDSSRNMISYIRTDRAGKQIVVICNFSPSTWEGCIVGVPDAVSYQPALCSDEARFGGGGREPGVLKVDRKTPCHGFDQSITLDVPPMCALFLVGKPRPKRAKKEPAKEEAGKAAAAGKKAPAAKKAAEKKAPEKKAPARKPRTPKQ